MPKKKLRVVAIDPMALNATVKRDEDGNLRIEVVLQPDQALKLADQLVALLLNGHGKL